MAMSEPVHCPWCLNAAGCDESEAHRRWKPTLKQAEQVFLDISIEVWREIDRLAAQEGGYPGLPSSTALRQRERAAWEQYRDLLDKESD